VGIIILGRRSGLLFRGLEMPRPTILINNVNKANFNSAIPVAWNTVNGGGDWWDSTATANGTSPWATQTVTDTDTVKLVSFDVTTLFQKIYDNANWCSAVIIGATGSAANQLFAGNTYSDSAKRPKISYDGGADQSITDEAAFGNGYGAGASVNGTEQYVAPDLGTSAGGYSRWLLVVPPPATRPTSATLKVYTTQQFGDQDVKVFWLRYPPESAPILTSYTYARPASDITTQWTPSSGTSHYALINEVTPDDANYIYATAASQTDEVKLGPMTTPNAGTSVNINYRVQGIVVGASVTTSLYCNTTLIKADTARTTNGTYTMTVTSAEWASVADWTNMRIRFVSA